MARVPPIRLRAVNHAPMRRDGRYVVYWMIAARRATHNYGLQRAVEHAEALGKPLLVLEPLRVDYRWASDRLHRFVLDGMADNRRRFARRRVRYHPYVEPEPGAGKGLLEALAAEACVVVTDTFPTFFLPRAVAAAGRRLGVRLEEVDSCGLLPLRATDRAYPTAYAFRRLLHRALPPHLREPPLADPLARAELPAPAELPAAVTRRWPAVGGDLLAGDPASLAALPVDHRVPPVPYAGGTRAAVGRLRRWLRDALPRYAEGHRHPDDDAASGLSPWLHFGHLSAHQVFAEVAAREGWSPGDLPTRGHGRREGWWRMGPDAEAFLDELVTWRELGYHFCTLRSDHDRYGSLPEWARATLDAHRRDRRPHLYSRDRLEAAETDDPVWNAAQRQLLAEGRIHNHLRMLWGKKVIEWSASPEQALETLVELNNRHAVDGRDPNSHSGIFWCFGRHDRPWPERPIFGKVRYMSSASTRRKLRMTEYLRRWGSGGPTTP
ncbi:MAG: deoxyribodipyrimidine photolyase [Myxococcota bacterium]